MCRFFSFTFDIEESLPFLTCNVQVHKCYDVKFQFTKYVELMSEYLQSKRIVDEYVHRSTNDKRNKSDECIWKASMELKDEVTAHLVKL